MDIYEARWRNAKRIAERIIEMQEKGWLVFDENNFIIGKVEIIKDCFSIECIIETKDSIVDYWFENDIGADEGLYTTISDFNKRFKDWKCIDPKKIVSLTLE